MGGDRGDGRTVRKKVGEDRHGRRSGGHWNGASGGRWEKMFACFYSQEVGQSPLDNKRHAVWQNEEGRQGVICQSWTN